MSNEWTETELSLAQSGMVDILINDDELARVPGDPNLSATKLAEVYAIDKSHPEWLDDPDHDVWYAAFLAIEEYEALQAL